MNRTRALALASTAALLVASCGGTEDEVGLPDAVPASSTQTAEQTPTARFLSTDLPVVPGPATRWISYSDPAAFAEDSDVVFVGRVMNTRANVFQLGPNAEDAGEGLVYEFDGIVFSVEEVLSGVVESDEMTVAVPIVSRLGAEGEPRKIRSDLVSVLEPALSGDASAQYLVFVVDRAGVDGIKFFNTAAGIVEIDADGRILEGAPNGPFGYRENSDREIETHGLDIALVRDWINGRPPQQPLPPEGSAPTEGQVDEAETSGDD